MRTTHKTGKRPNLLRSSKTFKGVVLIEALVAILILSFGLLGVAGLQINALAFQKSSWSTHRVAELSIDIAERIRANPVAAIAGNYVYTSNYATGQSATLTVTGCRSAGSTCTAAQIASDDIAALLTKAQTRLPRGSMQLTGDINNGYEITAIWRDKDYAEPPVTCSGTPSGVAWRTCCPSAAAVSTTDLGVRCARSVLIP
jgi:type IV pilus assembly protein PilV